MNTIANTKQGLLSIIVTLCAVLGLKTIMDTVNPILPTGINAVNPLPQIGEKPKVPFKSLTPKELDTLKYIQSIDYINDSLSDDNDDKAWKCVAILKHKMRTLNNNDRHIKVKTLWPNGEKSWTRVDALRVDDPYILVAYATKNNLTEHDDWKWVKQYKDTHEKFINITKSYKTSQSGPRLKFGIEVPMGVKQALMLDSINGNSLWRDAIDKELKQINDYRTFRRLDIGEPIPDDYKRIPYHIVFDVKFDLRRKARLVAGGNWTEPPKEDVYSGVVGMDTIRLGFLLASMNGLEICAADIGNAFLYGRTQEKVYIIAGPEFGELQGLPLIIDKGLYGLRTSAARFHEHLAEKLRKMGFLPSKADHDFWFKDCGDHYEYIATYVDDVLVYSRHPMDIINELKEDYILKGIGVPEYYLGGDIEQLPDAWIKDELTTALSARTYIKNVTDKFEDMLGTEFRQFKSPMAEGYHPELDDSPLLDPRSASRFRTMIGSANWIITLGRFDINYAVQALSRFNMAPREGHLKAMKRVFGYLKKFYKGRIIIDNTYPDHSKYEAVTYENWQEFYPDASEDIPPDMPTPRGKAARMTVYVDADHAHDQVTRRSVTGILLMVNNTPIRWVSKRQKTVETSTYSSELVAARIAVELIVEYRYILRMLGVPVNEPAMLLGDNESVILNTTVPSSVLEKKHNAIAYHRIREAIAGKIVSFAHVNSDYNRADVLTKPLSNDKFLNLVMPVLF